MYQENRECHTINQWCELAPTTHQNEIKHDHMNIESQG